MQRSLSSSAPPTLASVVASALSSAYDSGTQLPSRPASSPWYEFLIFGVVGAGLIVGT